MRKNIHICRADQDLLLLNKYKPCYCVSANSSCSIDTGFVSLTALVIQRLRCQKIDRLFQLFSPTFLFLRTQ